MRHLAALSGLLLILSCSVDPVQNPDGAGTGTGGTSGSGGQAGTTTGGGGQAGDRPVGGSGGGEAGAGGGPTGAGGGFGGRGGGGRGDHGTDAGETCAQIETDYGNALSAARQCTPGAMNQCQHLVETSLACPGCKEYVNDVTNLNAISTEWNDQDCSSTTTICPAIACVTPGTGTCMESGGSAACQNGVPGPAPP
jgi:hypothetical protein